MVIEAMACGTPVIAWDSGAMPEIVDEGVTGFIVRSISEAVDAVRRVPELDRELVRLVFEQRFSAARMVDEYAAIYARLVSRSGRAACGQIDGEKLSRLPAGTGAAWRCSTNENSIRPSR